MCILTRVHFPSLQTPWGPPPLLVCPMGQGHTIPVTSAALVLETSTQWGEPPCTALHAVYAPPALSQLVAHQVAQQLWGSHHLPPCRPPAYLPVPVTSHTGQALGQGPLAPVPSPPPPVPGVASSGQESGQVLLPPVHCLPGIQVSLHLPLCLTGVGAGVRGGGVWLQGRGFAADPQQSGSLLESLAMLTDLCPSLAAPVIPVAEQVSQPWRLCLAPRRPSPFEGLPEGVGHGVLHSQVHTQEAARGTGQQEDVPPQGVLDFPKALPLGKFLKPTNSPFSPKVVLAHEAIPLSALPPSQEDLLLLPVRSHSSPRSCQLPDKVVADWEEIAQRGLETASVMDAFLGGLIEVVRDPDPSLQGFRLQPEMDPGQICAFTRSVTQGLRFLSSSLARLHTNCVLARRDAVLCSSLTAASPEDRASLRVVPVTDGSLSGRHVRPFLKNQAELRLDTALPSRRPPKRSAPATAMSTSFGGRPPGSARPHPPRSPRKFKVFPSPGSQALPFQKTSPPMTCPRSAPATCCPPPPPPNPRKPALSPSSSRPGRSCRPAGGLSGLSDRGIVCLGIPPRHPSLHPPPPPPPPTFQPPSNPQALAALDQEVAALLSKGTSSPGFYGRIFVVPKLSRGWRPVLDLSALNTFLTDLPFQMETPSSVRDSVHRGDWATSIDLLDAYFHILIHPWDRKWLRFVWRGRVFQFRALPFGLAPAPWIFTKVVRELCVCLR